MNLYTQVTALLWAATSVFMVAAASTVKKAVKRQSHLQRAVHLFFLIGAFILIYIPFISIGFLGWVVIPPSTLSGLIGIGLCVFGLAFCLWARSILGKNWSGAVTLKKGHELVQAGPYRLVRHPMYTGVLTALSGAALTVGELKGFMGIAFLALSFLHKMGLEETYMTQHFGKRYQDYSKRVERLIPFLY